MYDNYREIYYTKDEVLNLFNKYLLWCLKNDQTPEVNDLQEVDGNNIGHVVYHANLL